MTEGELRGIECRVAGYLVKRDDSLALIAEVRRLWRLVADIREGEVRRMQAEIVGPPPWFPTF